MGRGRELRLSIFHTWMQEGRGWPLQTQKTLQCTILFLFKPWSLGWICIDFWIQGFKLHPLQNSILQLLYSSKWSRFVLHNYKVKGSFYTCSGPSLYTFLHQQWSIGKSPFIISAHAVMRVTYVLPYYQCFAGGRSRNNLALWRYILQCTNATLADVISSCIQQCGIIHLSVLGTKLAIFPIWHYIQDHEHYENLI